MGVIAKAFPFTATLTFLSVTVGTTIGLVIGIITAVYQRTWVDNIGIVLTVFFFSIPTFWLGLMLILISRWDCAYCRCKGRALGGILSCRWPRWRWARAR